jgi:hypothetical protein
VDTCYNPPSHAQSRKETNPNSDNLANGLRLASRLEQVGFSDIVKLRNRIMELRNQGRDGLPV